MRYKGQGRFTLEKNYAMQVDFLMPSPLGLQK